MSRTITIASNDPSSTLRTVSDQQGGTTTTSANFVLDTEKFGLEQSVRVGNKKVPLQWTVSCESIDWANSEYNVAARFNNNVITYKIPSDPAGLYYATVPDGRYSVLALATAFKTAVIANGAGHFSVVDGVDVPVWELTGDGSTQKFIFQINDTSLNGTHIIFAAAVQFYGIEAQTISATKAAENLADLNNGVSSYFLVIDSLVKNTFIGTNEISFVSQFQPRGSPGSVYKYVRNPRQWFEVNNKTRITRFSVRVLDQRARQILMPGGNANPLTIQLRFKAVQRQLSLPIIT